MSDIAQAGLGNQLGEAWYDLHLRTPSDAAGAHPDSLATTLDAATSLPDEAAAASVTQRLGRFVLLRKLGAGGMGTVFAAYDEELDRRVAVKLLHAVDADQTLRRQRVLREAQAMARVSHPNVVQVYDVGQLGDQIFIAMEYIEGTTLAERVQARLSWPEALRLYRQAGEGLLAAHQAGLVHRDFKPENVLVDGQGRVRVADFGLAMQESGSSPQPTVPVERTPGAQPVLSTPLTATGTLTGTPGYMAPEQFRGQPADSRSDQFAFCVALYEALYHHRAFRGETVAEVSGEVLAGRLQPIPDDSGVPIELKRALLRGLDGDPRRRFPTMAELLQALDVDGERDPAGARLARRRLSFALIAATLIFSSIGASRVQTHHVTMVQLTSIMGVVVAIFALGMLFFRRTLLANVFHRGLVWHTLSCCITLLAVRLLATQLGFPIEKYYPLDLMTMAGMMAGMALHYLPRLLSVSAMFVGASLGAWRWPGQSELLANLCYTLLPVAFIYFWGGVATERPTEKSGP